MDFQFPEDDRRQLVNEINAVEDKMFSALMDYCKTGYLRSVACVLAYMEEDKKNAVLKEFDDKEKDFINEYIKNNNLNCKDVNVMSEVSHALVFENLDNASLLEEIYKKIKYIDMKDLGIIKEQLEQKNPILSMMIDEEYFDFNDLTVLDDRAIQKVLREVDTQELVKALKGSSPEVKDKIFRNMSRRAAMMIQEDMEFMGPVRKRDVDECKSKICSIVLRLCDSGEIILPKNDQDIMIV